MVKHTLPTLGITWAVSFVLFAVTQEPLFGQAGASGSILGIVTDPLNAAVPGAEITVRNEGTGITNFSKTNAVGRYEFVAMAIGTYTVTATAPGFKAASVHNVVLSVGAKYAVDIELSVGDVTESVEVQAQTPLLQTESNTVSHLVENKTLVEMPLNGRDYQQLQLLTPGVVSGYNFQTQQGLGGGASIGGPSSTLTSNIVNGMRANGTSFVLDGGDTSSQAFRVTQFVPPLDAVAEFSQVSSNATAEYGYGPTTVNVAVKSGTNEFRGVAWEFVRNKVFDARSFFAPRTDDLKRNQFGLAVGGPILKNRAFFFVSYEGIRQGLSAPTFATVPLSPWRNGDFSSALGASAGTDALGRTVLANQIFDPLTSRNVTAGQVDAVTGLTGVRTAVVREPFVGNIVPQARINPASALILSRFIPLPNAPGTANNYAAQGVSTLNPDNLLLKFDVRLSDRDRVFFTGGQFFDHAPGSPGPYSPSDQGLSERTIPGKTGVLGWNHIFSPTTLLDFRFSDSWAQGIFTSPTVDPARGGKDIVAELGIDPVNGGLPFHADTPGVPTVSITGFTGTAGLSHFPTGWRMNQMLWSANLSSLRGKHHLQFGYAYRYWKGGFSPRATIVGPGSLTDRSVRRRV